MAEPLWTVEELQKSTGGTLHGAVRYPLSGVSIDSRSIAPGDIFVAIKGDNADGHAYAAKALHAGAGIALVHQCTDEMRKAGPVLELGRDPLLAMEDMGRAARACSAAKIIAVTGSVGKTSTKDMLAASLAPSGKTHYSVSSFNNHWGVPLTLARFPRDAAYGIFEIGMNHAGEITPLVGLVQPHIAIITSIAASHLGHFASLEEIADAKAEIFTGLVKDGTAILPKDSPHFGQLLRTAQMRGVNRIVTFGKAADADIVLEQAVFHPGTSSLTVNLFGERISFRLGLGGEHMALNSLAVLAAVQLAGADMAQALIALANAKPSKGRGVQETLQAADGEITLIDESYNANPASVRAALRLLKQSNARRRIAVLGDMLELGKFGEDLHRELAQAAQDEETSQVFACGPLMQHMWNALPATLRGGYAQNSAALKDVLLASAKAGDAIMIKGSLGSKMGLLAEAMRQRYALARKDTD